MTIDVDKLLDSKHVTVSTKDTHKATATVGKDTIEAEYHTYERVDWFGINEPKWTLWDKITTPFWKIKRWFKDTYWEIRYGFQRMFKGYDSVDTFETFYKFIERYTKILTEYKKKHCGIPMEFENSAEEWDKVIDEMLYHLHYMDEERVTKELENAVPDGWHVSQIIVDNIMLHHKDEFFKLFSKYFYDLWD
jgi:hypothetical protein